MSYIAQQYAEALFGLTLESKSTKSVLENFKSLNQAIDDDINKFLNHPKVSKKDKKAIIEQTVLDVTLRHFVFVLIDNSRIEYLSDCLGEFEKIINVQDKVMKVQAFSGKKLSKEQIEQLVSNLGKKHNRKIELDNIVDKSIVGGIRIEYDGNILDETINNYLHGLKANLTK
jgi:F-type H+-transporting ATPase subunit delta